MWGKTPSKKPKFLVVEIERPRPILPLEDDMAETLLSLRGHPGFQYLLNKLRFQRSVLESSLLQNRQATMQDVEFIKSGIAWTKWLDDQLSKAAGLKSRAPTAPASKSERDVYEELKDFVEVLGNEPDNG